MLLGWSVFGLDRGEKAESGKALPAFPGAEGFGAPAVGGRGGKVIHVTNLNESGPGSFRAALEERGPRIIVFDVGGTIELRSELKMPNDNGYVTIAGQTAPGGITIIGGSVGLPGWSRTGVATDIIARHLRVRGAHNIASPGQGGDCLNVYNARRAIIDHCSFTGSCDETFDAIHTRDLTAQWCTIEEPALWGQGGNQHDEGDHNLGFIFSYPPAANCSFHHNLTAHSSGRNPLITFGPADVRNNVVYNFGIGFDAGRPKLKNDGTRECYNVVGNYLRKGSGVRRSLTPLYGFGHGGFYLAGNMLDLEDDLVVELNDPWKQLGKEKTLPAYVVFWDGETSVKLARPTEVPPVATQSAKEAYKLVLANAGAWPRDATTRRIVREVESRTGEYGLGGPYERFPARSDGPTSVKYDKDRDGMPDAWEKEHGLDPNNPEDGSETVPPGASPDDRHAGYTYVEYYLNDLSDRIVGVTGETCKLQVEVEGTGRVVCAHSGRTPRWATDPGKVPRQRGYNGNPVEVDRGKENVFNKGSAVVLKALPQESLGVGAPVVSRFGHWSGGPVEGAKKPVISVTVDRDVKIVAHFLPK